MTAPETTPHPIDLTEIEPALALMKEIDAMGFTDEQRQQLFGVARDLARITGYRPLTALRVVVDVLRGLKS